jgi:hypothetical protein
MPRKGSYRYTVETIASGQPRPYADTIHHVRVTFEHVPWLNGKDEFEPACWDNEEAVRDVLQGLRCGFTDFAYPPKDRPSTTEDYYRTRLDWLKRVEPNVWEFHTTSAFTD